MNNDNRIYNYKQLQRELMASIYLVAATDNIINEPSILLDKAGESSRITQHLQTIQRLLNAITDNRAMGDDGNLVNTLYASYRG